MAGSINKTVLMGHLGRDPEIRTFQNGGKVCNLSLATSETWKDKESGERKERVEWHRVTIYNSGLIKVAEDYLKKGSRIYIEGRNETRKYTDGNGVEKYTTEVVLRPYRSELHMLDRKPNGDTSGDVAPDTHDSDDRMPPDDEHGGFGGYGGGFEYDPDPRY